MPCYSAWTEKRKVRFEDIWPGTALASGGPNHLVQIRRSEDAGDVRMSRLEASEVLSILLHQTVVPNDPAMARGIVSTIASTARHLTGWVLDLGEDAYRKADCLVPLEEALQ